MSKKALYLLGILLTILIGTFFYWKQVQQGYCCGAATASSSEMVTDTSSEVNSKSTQATFNNFSLKDPSGNFSFKSENNFDFNVSGFDVLTPVDSKLTGGIDQLKAYLDTNANKSISITGLYSDTEENTSAFPNLGLARANAVKNYFNTKGIANNRINTSGKLGNDLVPDGTIYRGPVTFSMLTSTEETKDKEAEALAALEAKIKENPLVLYFKTGANSISLSAQQRQKIADISTYLDKKEGAQMVVSGHTDNTGSRAINIKLGQERANFLKQYFVNNNIDASKIKAISIGPDKPIASNATEGGKAKNRRAEVTIN